MTKARLARFYGWTDQSIDELDHDVAHQYLMCIEPLSAAEMMSDLQVSVFPNLKRERQRKVEKDIRKRMQAHLRSEKPQNTEDLYYHMLRTLGNG